MIFKNYGGSVQYHIESAEDLKQIQELDEAHWVATSAPVELLDCSDDFLKFVDLDENGEIRVDEVREACSWLLHHLSEYKQLTRRSETLQLKHIDTNHENGQKIKNAALRLLDNIDAENNNEVRLGQVRDVRQIHSRGAANGDGVIPADAIEEKNTREFVQFLIECYGGEPDVSGNPGVTSAHLDRFETEVEQYFDWKKQATQKSSGTTFGDSIDRAYRVYRELYDKLNEFFQICSLRAFDPELAKSVHSSPHRFDDESEDNRVDIDETLKDQPLAPPNSDAVLDFESGPLNSHYHGTIQQFRREVLEPIPDVNSNRISFEDWERVQHIGSSRYTSKRGRHRASGTFPFR
ncbi:MAG: hypothetical protein ABEJ65_07405 [bacterium]